MAKEKKVETKKKKTWLYVLICVLVLVIAFLLWWFLRTFEVTMKYNNGDADEVLYVRYLNVIKKEDVRDDLTNEGYTFVGYFETYYLSGEEIAKVKADSKNEETICKEGFALNSEKIKCVAEEEFDFEKTKIKEVKTIEAMWAKAADNSAVSIKASSSCAIGTNAVTLTANITGSSKVKGWTVPSCYTDSKVSANAIKVTRNGNCPNGEPDNATIKVTLENGKTASYNLKYEPTLKVTVYNDSNNPMTVDSDGRYGSGCKYVESNMKATFSVVSQYGSLLGTTDTRTQWNRSADTQINVKTSCGQSQTVRLAATIN